MTHCTIRIFNGKELVKSKMFTGKNIGVICALCYMTKRSWQPKNGSTWKNGGSTGNAEVDSGDHQCKLRDLLSMMTWKSSMEQTLLFRKEIQHFDMPIHHLKRKKYTLTRYLANEFQNFELKIDFYRIRIRILDTYRMIPKKISLTDEIARITRTHIDLV